MGRCALYARVPIRCLRGLPLRVSVPRGGCASGGYRSQGGIFAAKGRLAGC